MHASYSTYVIVHVNRIISTLGRLPSFPHSLPQNPISPSPVIDGNTEHPSTKGDVPTAKKKYISGPPLKSHLPILEFPQLSTYKNHALL